jgi:hypothetical protein
MTAGHEFRTTVSMKGNALLVNGEPTTLLGFRVPSAAMRDEWTDELIAQMDQWQAHGVNAFTVWLQGASGGFAPVIAPTGEIGTTEMDVLAHIDFSVRVASASIGQTTGAQVIARAHRIIREADKRGMVVVLGLFYRSSTAVGDFTADALRNASRSIATEFRSCGNVILNVFNEANTSKPLESYDNLVSYMREAKLGAPDRPVGTGSVTAETSAALSRADELDIVLFDAGAGGREAIAALEMLRAFTDKPIANVESFKGSGHAFLDDRTHSVTAPAGYYIDYPDFRRVFGAWEDEDYWTAAGQYAAGRNSYLRLIDDVCADTRRQTHLLVHAAGWFQGASRVAEPARLGRAGTAGAWSNTFAVGHGRADGTTENPGIQWILDYFRRKRDEAAKGFARLETRVEGGANPRLYAREQ